MTQRFYVLDSFRGIAAIFVVIHHMHFSGSITELNFFKASSLFVEFFFVLSGFVLTHAYAFKKKPLFKSFIIARTFRIVPLHITMLAGFIFLELLKLLAFNYGVHFNFEPFTNHTDPISIIPHLLLLQSWFPNSMVISWNGPAWSISIEYYMYMIFFLTLLIKKPKQYILWIFISLSSFYFIFSNIEFWENFNMIARGLSSFFAGGLTYLVYRKLSHRLTINTLYYSILEILLIVLVIIVVSSNITNKLLIVSFLFCLKVLIFSFERGVISSFLKQNFFQLLGKLSYSIYMVHTILLLIFISVFRIFQKIVHVDFMMKKDNIIYFDFGSAVYNNIVIFIFLGIVIFISQFTYKYIELKGQEFGKKLKDV